MTNRFAVTSGPAILSRMNGHEIRVREAAEGDVGRLAPLFDAYRQFYGLPSDLELSTRFLKARLARRESLLFVAEGGTGTISGFAQVYPSFSSLAAAPAWILYDLFVTPADRKMGVGRLLLESVRRSAEAAGVAEVVLSTAHTNVNAQKLYESMGYRRDMEFATYILKLK